MRAAIILGVLSCLIVVRANAQKDQYFVSNSFQNYNDRWSPYKRTYKTLGDTLETKDYIRERLVMMAQFANDYGKETIDGFLKFHRSGRKNPEEAIKYKDVNVLLHRLQKDTVDRKIWYVNSRLLYLEVYDDQGRQVLDEAGNGVLQEDRKNSATYFEVYQDSLLRYSYRLEESGDTIHYQLDKTAEPVGGFRQFYEEFVPKIEYPLTQIELGNEATFYIQFVVNENGTLSNFKCLNENVPEFEKSVMKQLSRLKKWTPAVLDGRNVKSGYTLPVAFRLTDR